MNIDTLLLNDVQYTLNIRLENADGNIMLPSDIFYELYLEESFGSWPVKGYLVFNNAFEQLERYQTNPKKKNTELFNFRMDGSDIISIELVPQLRADSSRSKGNLKNFPVDDMNITLYLSIYDSEDLSQSDISHKYKKLYFHDYTYNEAIGSNQRVSCGEYLAKTGVDATVLSNTDREVLTGDLLKYICTDKLHVKISEDDWDSGANKILFTSNTTDTIYDNIEYILNTMHCDDGFPAWFGYDRLKHEFVLKSYKTIFDEYPETLREVIKFNDGKSPAPAIAPIRFNTTNIWSLPSFSDILSYKYTKMSPQDNITAYNSILTNTYNSETKKFETKVGDGYIGDFKDKTSGLLSTFNKEMQQPSFIINEKRLLNSKVINKYPLASTSPYNDLLKSYVFLNDAISFEVLGMTNRTVGTFIEIANDADAQCAWDDRFLGTWFVLNVTHIVTTETYINRILAVKLNIPNSVKITDGSEIKRQEVETVEDRNAS